MPVTLQLATVIEAITVTAAADAIINPNRTGSTSRGLRRADRDAADGQPQLQDFARTNPYFNVDAARTSRRRA